MDVSTSKPSRLNLVDVVASIQIPPPLYFRVHTESDDLFLQVCNGELAQELEGGRKWRLSRWMTKSEVVQTAFKAYVSWVEHEARETFTYRGAAIFGPHFDVDVLVGVYRGAHFDVRVPA